jgi:hypothetical protein
MVVGHLRDLRLPSVLCDTRCKAPKCSVIYIKPATVVYRVARKNKDPLTFRSKKTRNGEWQMANRNLPDYCSAGVRYHSGPGTMY